MKSRYAIFFNIKITKIKRSTFLGDTWYTPFRPDNFHWVHPGTPVEILWSEIHLQWTPDEHRWKFEQKLPTSPPTRLIGGTTVFNGGSRGENLVWNAFWWNADEKPMNLHVRPSAMRLIYTKDSNHAAVTDLLSDWFFV